MIMPMEIECVCPFCGEVHTVTVDAIDYLAWEMGMLSCRTLSLTSLLMREKCLSLASAQLVGKKLSVKG